MVPFSNTGLASLLQSQQAIAAQQMAYQQYLAQQGTGFSQVTNPYHQMATTSLGPTIWFNQTSSSTTTCGTIVSNSPAYIMPMDYPMQLAVYPNQTLLMPDGSRLVVDANGSYKIEDKDAKVTYAANRSRAFNRFINASDRLEDFIRYCGKEAQISKEDMLEIPIKLFIAWLILEAAKADNEPEPDDIKLLPDLQVWKATRQTQECAE